MRRPTAVEPDGGEGRVFPDGAESNAGGRHLRPLMGEHKEPSLKKARFFSSQTLEAIMDYDLFLLKDPSEDPNVTWDWNQTLESPKRKNGD